MKKTPLAVAGTIWVGVWFWAFSFAYSSSFFLYNRHTRLPIFLACLLCLSTLPVSAFAQWRRVSRSATSPILAFGYHMLLSVALLGLPLMLIFVFSRASGSWHLEADDAMGVGIDIALLLLAAVSIAGALGVALAIRGRRRDQGR